MSRAPLMQRLLASRLAAGVALVAMGTALPAVGHAQSVELRGRGDIDNDVFLRDFLARGGYTLIARDTIVARGDTLPGPVLVAGATLRLDGVVAGDLVIVDANVFLRPTSRVLGGVRNIAGGFYPSEQATVAGPVRAWPVADYMVERRGAGDVVIVGTVQRSNLVLYGLRGLLPPTYDRVDGLSVGAGAGLLLPRVGRIEPQVRARGDYRSQRGRFGGALELVAPRGWTEVLLGVERTTLTNERWIRSDLVNSVSALFQGKDRRDYFEVERAYAEVSRTLEDGPRATSAFVRAQVEDAVPLPAGDPWSVLGSFREDNMQFEANRISSVIVGLATEWTAPRYVIELEAAVEAGGTVLDGDHSFARYVVNADWAMPALANHTLRVQPHFQGPLPGTRDLPGQRWSFVGGSGTLNTFEQAAFRGDRVAMVETRYSIPLPRRFRFSILGQPDFELLHAAGMAWSADERPGFEQNIGVRLAYRVAYVRVMTHPDRLADDAEFSVGLRVPSRAWPWQEER
jgi:hypothetical protein